MVDTARPVPDAHGCGFPDAPCRSCEATVTPPCCNTPYLCGGPFEDCHPTADGYNQAYQPGDDPQAEAIANIRRPIPDNCLTGFTDCNYDACCGDRRPDERQRADDNVVHERVSRCGCDQDGGCWVCR